MNLQTKFSWIYYNVELPDCFEGRGTTHFFRAPLINGSISTVDQMTMCNVKAVTCCDKDTRDLSSGQVVPLRSTELFKHHLT